MNKSKLFMRALLGLLLLGVATWELIIICATTLPYSQTLVEITDAVSVPALFMADIFYPEGVRTGGGASHWGIIFLCSGVVFYAVVWFAILSWIARGKQRAAVRKSPALRVQIAPPKRRRKNKNAIPLSLNSTHLSYMNRKAHRDEWHGLRQVLAAGTCWRAPDRDELASGGGTGGCGVGNRGLRAVSLAARGVRLVAGLWPRNYKTNAESIPVSRWVRGCS